MNNSQTGIIKAIFTGNKIDKLIPEKGLKLLPFTPESINSWAISNLDVVDFLKYLCNREGKIVYEDGKKEKINYQDYWKDIFYPGKKEFKKFAEEFKIIAEKIKPVPGSTVKEVKIPSFLDDKYFGLVAKYYIIYNGIIEEVLTESYFYSIAHMIESEEELSCSILLSKNLYYKQSVQVLRNYIELLVSQIFFCSDSNAFKQWKRGDFNLPRLRGNGGLLEKLAKSNFISSDLSERTAKLYGDLNSYIHSTEGRLIHRGVHKGKYIGFIFDHDYFMNWCKMFSKTVESGILLLNAHLEQIFKIKENGVVCSICHNKKDFKISEEEYAGTKYLKLKCKKCNNEME